MPQRMSSKRSEPPRSSLRANVIAGEDDRFTPLSVMEKMWRSIPSAEFLVIPRGTHTALVENPLLMNMRIELFLRDHFHERGYPGLKALG